MSDLHENDETDSFVEPLAFYHSTPCGATLIDSINEMLDENLISLSMAESILVSQVHDVLFSPYFFYLIVVIHYKLLSNLYLETLRYKISTAIAGDIK